MPRARRVSHATLVPLGQPEKAMGHESPIEPWLAPDNRAACGSRADWLRRAPVMKTAGREHPKRCRKEAASRALGTEGQNNPAQTGRAGRQEKIQRPEKCFLLDSFYRSHQDLARSCRDSRDLSLLPMRLFAVVRYCVARYIFLTLPTSAAAPKAAPILVVDFVRPLSAAEEKQWPWSQAL